jgi:hypothetical protein
MKEKLLSAMHSLKNVNIPSLGFIAVTTHIVMMGAGIGDALALMSISALYGYKSYIETREKEIDKTLSEELSYLKTEISSLKLKTLHTPSTDKAQPKRFF